MQEEFVGATKLCKEIKRTDGGRTNWQRLFEPYDFFKTYKNYLQVGLQTGDLSISVS